MKFYSKGDRTRRGCAAVTIGFGLLILVGIGYGLVADRVFTTGSFTFLAVLALPVLAAIVVLFLPRETLEIDEKSGTAFHRVGRNRRPIPFANLGRIRIRQYVYKTQKSRTTRYAVELPSYPSIVIHDTKDEAVARRKMEEVAKVLGIATESRSGEVRDAAELDQPFFERKRADETLLQPAKLRPSCVLEVRHHGEWCEILSSYRPKTPLVIAVIVLLLGPGFVLFSLDRSDWEQMFDPAAMSRAPIWLFLVFTTISAIASLFFFYEYFSERRIVVTPDHVKYRFRTIPIDEIEEIDRVGESPRLVTDQRIVDISSFFCPEEDVRPLLHEIRRAVVVMGRARNLREKLGMLDR